MIVSKRFFAALAMVTLAACSSADPYGGSRSTGASLLLGAGTFGAVGLAASSFHHRHASHRHFDGYVPADDAGEGERKVRHPAPEVTCWDRQHACYEDGYNATWSRKIYGRK